MTPPTPVQLMARVEATVKAVELARADMVTGRSPEAAMAFCRACSRMLEARSALPPLRLVS